jgi:CHAT domain-containing protein
LNITYIPSVGAASAIYKSTKIPFESILVVEDPTSTLQYAPIESASALMHFNIKDLIGGEAATKDEVIAHLSGKNVLHFSCHGYSDPSNPQQSGLIMANAEALKVVDIHQVRLNSTRLVVLSACQTGLIGRKLMDEVEGFPSTWLGIGVPGIISTLWSVDDRSTSILMRSFYENLKVKGLRPDEALRQAQIFLRDTPGGLYEHPFYWGAFFMTGL